MGLAASILALLPDNTDEEISPQDIRDALGLIAASIDDSEDFVGDLTGVYQAADADLTTLAAATNSAVLAATTASFLTADETKLDGIEAGADVTDATNVAAAGAVMEADTSTASMSFVVDEDNMASDSATKVPTQQSTKAYVDAHTGDSSAAHAATAIANTPAGNVAATNVQAAIDELDTEKQAADADLTALAAMTTPATTLGLYEELIADSLTPYQFYDSTPTTGVSASEFSSVTAVFYEPGYADGGQLVPCLPLAALGDPYVIAGDITGNPLHATPGLLQFTRPGVYMLRAKLRVGTTAPSPAIDAFGYNGTALMFLSPFDADGFVYAINDANRPGSEIQAPVANYDASGTRAVANFFTPIVVPPDGDYTPDPYYPSSTSPSYLEGDGTVVPVGWDLKIEFQASAPTAWWGADSGITIREVGIWITRVA